MKVDWGQCILQSRCRLNSLNLNNEYFDNLTGIFIIWSEDGKKKFITVGKGIIRNELLKMKNNENVKQYEPDLFVTWAEVPLVSLEGVENFLCSKLNPILQPKLNNRDLIEVNLP